MNKLGLIRFDDLILFIGIIKDSCQFHLQDDKLRFEFNLNRK